MMRVGSLESSISVIMFAVLCGLATGQSAWGGDMRQKALLRRPVALVTADDWLFVANQRSGSISVVDPARRAVIREIKVGSRLADLAVTPDGRFLLAVDEQQHELILLERRGTGLRVLQRLPVAPAPVGVRITSDGGRCTVASLWSRRVTIVELAPSQDTESPWLSASRTIDLPFAPREQVLVRDDTVLIVADSFAGNLAIIDLVGMTQLGLRTLSGHNIRGLAVSHNGRDLLITHQILNGGSPTTEDGVFWGNVIANVIRSAGLEELLAKAERPSVTGRLYPLGHPGGAMGDPADMLVTSSGRTCVSLAGVDEIAVRPTPRERFVRRPIGRRPTALAPDAKGLHVFVANTLGDSISVLNLPDMKVEGHISLGAQPELSLADRGELLFYDARLSLDGWYSCHSCHTDGHSNGLLNDNFGDATFGAPKRVLSLLGAGQTGPWGWNASKKRMGDQIRESIRVTMQGPEATDEEVQAIEAYVRTLKPPPSRDQLRGILDQQSVQPGKLLFQEQGCADCHRPPTYTSSSNYDVGVHDSLGARRFNPPSLRGVGQRGAYFHDNRAPRLSDVFTRFDHGSGQELSRKQLDDLLAFVRSL